MKIKSRLVKKATSVILAIAVIMTMAVACPFAVTAASGTSITYNFSGSNSNSAGYAEGTITVSSDTTAAYYLYWANDTSALSGFYEIACLSVSAGGSASYKFGYHTAIPSGATKVIATKTTADKSVANAAAVYDIPASKQLSTGAGDLLYKFNSYSDIHIDKESTPYYVNAEKNWAQALKFGVDKGTDFIVSSGDAVTNASGPDNEWDAYEKILADSDYVNPVWESDGNHDMRTGVATGIKSFVRNSGTDSTIANYDANKPYYYMIEKSTGDIFIFMALENEYKSNQGVPFSSAQLTWVTNLLNEYYNSGVNVYIIEHAPINCYGAGDRTTSPYYKALLDASASSTQQFKALLEKYPKIIWMSGHTHEDLEMNYNYSNENGSSCNMIHNPSVAGTTWASGSDTSLNYDYNGKGQGKNTQGYYVEAYQNEVIFYGANLANELIYPAYSYIMEGSRSQTPLVTNPVQSNPDTAPQTTVQTPTLSGETKRVYFANTLNWSSVYCYSWATYDIETCTWPGYKATFYGSNLYYCDIPDSHEFIIWDNGDNGYQTGDITLDGVNNFFTPATTISSKNVPVTPSVWPYDTTTAPATTVETTTTVPATTIPATTAPAVESLGDVDLSGTIDVIDATTIQKHLVELIVLDNIQALRADVNADGVISIMDVTMIQMYVAEIITSFGDANNAKTASAVGASSLSAELTYVKTVLDAKYTFSSYDQYQSLKKLYYQYRNNPSVTNESAVVADFEGRLSALNTISEHIGSPAVYQTGDTYFFENTNDWSTVNCYAWNGSSENHAWPGVAMQKVGTNYGHDVYGIKFEYAGQYKNIVFNNGSAQTVDIVLSSYDKNCFYLDGTYTGANLNVGNFDYTSSVQPTVAPGTTQSVSDNNHYALCYYNGTAHGWNTIDTFLSKQSDGTYALDFVTKNSDDISLNIYDNSSSKYNCFSSSTSLAYTAGTTNTYSLVASSSRGKSLTISGLSTGVTIKFVYDPTGNTLKVTCGNVATTDPPEATTSQSTSTTYNLYMAPSSDAVSAGDSFKVNIKVSSSEYNSYSFVKTDRTYNGVPVYRATITDPSFTNVIKIQYQSWTSAGAFDGQVVQEVTTTLSYYNNKMMVCSSKTAGSLISYSI